MMPHTDNDQQTARLAAEHRRAFKACIACRERKAKCDLAGRDEPPCVRCRRGLRECVFPIERSWPKKRKTTHDGDQSMEDFDTSRVRRQSQISAAPNSGQHDGDTTVIGDRPSPNADASNSHGESTQQDFARSVMQTVVSNGNDALNLLFQAAGRNEDVDVQSDYSTQAEANNQGATHVQASLFGSNNQPIAISPSGPDVHRLWRSFRFVKEGWVSAEEVVTFVDLFFKNMAPLSPVLIDHFADHANHYQLVRYEPLLCCTILMLSSRYHVLPGAGGASRSYYIHDRFWKHCQHLISRLMFGQEKGSLAKTRTVGSIEALLLLSEWHPRALHFPPEADGWDSDLLLTAVNDTVPQSNGRPPNRWLEDVIEPARRSDRMSWMLLGSALSLAHELNVFDDGQETETATSSGDGEGALDLDKRARTRRLLYVFMTQLSLRLGTMSMLPQNLPQVVNNKDASRHTSWQTFMLAWVELTKLLKSVADMAFPSKSFTQDLFRSGRYVSLLEHCQLLLDHWKKSHLDEADLPKQYLNILFIEYQYARIYCNSVGMQAVCSRAIADHTLKTGPLKASLSSIDPSTQTYVEEVITGSCDLLRRVVGLAEEGTLHLAPVRIFLRLATSSVYLLKAMSIGVRPSQLQSALLILQATIDALNTCGLDQMHLANSYATLLSMHIKRLKRSFLASSRQLGPSRPRTRPGSPRPGVHPFNTSSAQVNSMGDNNGLDPMTDLSDWDDFNFNLQGDSDWLSLPFDSAMAPFGASGEVILPADLDIGLDFIWNPSTLVEGSKESFT